MMRKMISGVWNVSVTWKMEEAGCSRRHDKLVQGERSGSSVAEPAALACAWPGACRLLARLLRSHCAALWCQLTRASPPLDLSQLILPL